MSRNKRAAPPHCRKRNEAGERLCACHCGQVVQPPRRSWASQECVERWKEIYDPSWIRVKVYERDRGICKLCHLDVSKYYRRFQAGWRWHREQFEKAFWEKWAAENPTHPAVTHRMPWHRPPIETARLRGLVRKEQDRLYPGWDFKRSTGWDADHIIPVAEGGLKLGIDNLRTLCQPCHKGETAKLAARLAAAKKTPHPDLFSCTK